MPGQFSAESGLTIEDRHVAARAALLDLPSSIFKFMNSIGDAMFPFWIDYASLSFWEMAPWLMGAITWVSALFATR
jgi:hypothetical protein